jgi:L-galactose dehydrogenase/L-glyceraldehyde 3-phosphate reductase
MEYRQLGRTGREVSVLGFGCGAVGGLLIKGDRTEMVRVVARAIEAGITYFDTARSYGNGVSETNLGLVLEELKPAVVVGTKVQLRADEMENIEQAVIASVEGSLKRLRREQVDLIQLHNPVAFQRRPEREWVALDDLEAVVQAFQKLVQQGKARFYGINGLGDTPALHQAIAADGIATIQCCFNLLNPSAGAPAPAGFPFQDYGQLIDQAAAREIGVIAIRVLAGGALSGSDARDANAAQTVDPIGSGQDFAADVGRSHAFRFLVDAGYTESLAEAAIRFAISKAAVSTAMVGISNMEQLEEAIAAANKGPLPAEALDQIGEAWRAGH